MNTTDLRPCALIADDDEISRLFLIEALGQAGCRTVAVEDGAEALRVGLAEEFDLVLLDVKMPKLDGYGVCRALRATPHLKHLPIVMITGQDDAPSIARSFDAGATDFIAKPVNWNLLPHRMRYILRNAELDKQSRYLAMHDATTGLPNAQSLHLFIAAALDEETRQPGRGLALMQISIEEISRIRAVFGLEVGEQALKGFAARLTNCVRENQTAEVRALVGRIDGDNFVVCISSPLIRETAEALAQNISQSFDAPVICGAEQFFISPTTGIAYCPEHGGDAKSLLSHAATATQHALATAVKSAVAYTDAMGAQAIERLSLSAALRDAVREEKLTLVFQPKFNIASRSFIGVEALLRWSDPKLGQVSPARFVPLAEESGLILDIGRWVTLAACKQLSDWRDQGLETKMAINVSGKQFMHDNPVKYITQAANRFSIDPKTLIIEITESSLITDLTKVQVGLRELRALGYRVAMDDFGTGYSSLAYLKGLPVDELKLDRSFIRNVDSDAVDATICLSVLTLARNLGLSVTAEGIETDTQFEWLKGHDCGEAQGFLLARPAPGADILKVYGGRVSPIILAA